MSDKYYEHFRRDVLPALDQSMHFMCVTPATPDGLDIKIATELGAAILLDKPIIALRIKGRTVNRNMLRLARVVIDYDPTQPEVTMRLVKSAIERIEKENANAKD